MLDVIPLWNQLRITGLGKIQNLPQDPIKPAILKKTEELKKNLIAQVNQQKISEPYSSNKDLQNLTSCIGSSELTQEHFLKALLSTF